MFQILHLVSFNIYDNIKYNNFIFSSICIIFHQKQLPTHYNNTPFQASKNFQWHNLRHFFRYMPNSFCKRQLLLTLYRFLSEIWNREKSVRIKMFVFNFLIFFFEGHGCSKTLIFSFSCFKTLCSYKRLYDDFRHKIIDSESIQF